MGGMALHCFALQSYHRCYPFNQNFRKFRSKTQWIGSVQPEKFQNNWSTFLGGPLFPVRILVEWIAPHVSTILSLIASCHRVPK